MKTFYIKTLGCKVNQCDSQEIRDGLFNFGWQESSKGDKADLCIVNTCCVTHHADRKSRSAIRDVVRRNRGSLVAVTGCYAGYDRPVLEKIGGVNAVFENKNREQLFQWIAEFHHPGEVGRRIPVHSEPVNGRTRAFLKIQDGCDNYCSYCIVPFMRGPARSKDFSLVVEEAHRLVGAGYQEIVLTGVNLGSFGKDFRPKKDLVDVVCALEPIKGLSRIRLSSIEPLNITDSLIEKMAVSEKLCPHLHIPFQSGDDEVLSDMNKKLATRDYRRVVENARKRIKDLAITCDFIVGYPTERNENFLNTLDFVKFTQPLKTHIFTFSRRRGAGIKIKEDRKNLSSGEVKMRFNRLKALTDKLSIDFKRRYLNKNLSVLFEGKGGNLWQGYSENYIRVFVKSNGSLANMIRRVKVTDFIGQKVLGVID